LYFSLFGPKQSTKRKAAQQLGLRLSSRTPRTRGRQELIPLFAGLRQLATLNPYPHASLGCAATGFKTFDSKKQNISFIKI
jgi:hypothetical protein